MTFPPSYHDKQPGSSCDSSVYTPVPNYEIPHNRTEESPYACFPTPRNQFNQNYGSSTISVMTPQDHKHEYGQWNPRQFSHAHPPSRRFPEKLPPLPPLPLSANPPNRLIVATKTSTINPTCTNAPKYNKLNNPSIQSQKITDTGMKIINNGLLLDESKTTSTTAAIIKKTVQHPKDPSKSNRFKGYAIKITSGLKSSKNKSFSLNFFKYAAWEETSEARTPIELFRVNGEFSRILRSHIEKDWCDWIDGIISSDVRTCIKKHADALTRCNDEMYAEEKNRAVEELLDLILKNIQLSLKPGNKTSMPDECKSILACMNNIAKERFPDEPSTRGIVFNIFLFRYITPNLLDPTQLSKNSSYSSYMKIQQGLTVKLTTDSKCPNFMVPIFL